MCLSLPEAHDKDTTPFLQAGRVREGSGYSRRIKEYIRFTVKFCAMISLYLTIIETTIAQLYPVRGIISEKYPPVLQP